MTDRADRVAKEIEKFRRVENVHALPAIFNYWGRKFLRPHVQEIFGVADLHAALAKELRASIAASGNGAILSVGAGDGDNERKIAGRLIADGFRDFRFHCVELNPHSVSRGQGAVREAGLGDHFEFQVADLASWTPNRTYGAALAHHSLHHIDALEHVFDQVHASLHDAGAFVMADMIGRNGHMRWPEALEIMNAIWVRMPQRYKWHNIWGRQIDPYDNWDCSEGGANCEGIRAQDIMGELIKRFHFAKMCVWGGVTDVFVDRAYGHNLDPESAEDCAFIDDLWAKETLYLQSRLITPTVMIATVLKTTTPLVSSFGLTPRMCIRPAL